MKIYHFGSIDDFNRHKDNPNSYNTMLHTHGDNRLFVAVFLQRRIAIVIHGNAGYDFPHLMVVAIQQKSVRQDKRMIVVDNGRKDGSSAEG